jgi:hypothetical protein
MFESDINMVIGAIMELFAQMGNPPPLQANQLGPMITTYCGNGNWHMRGNSNYFNCGVNIRPNTPGPFGQKGHLSRQDGENVAVWFEQQYAQYRAKVLDTRGTKWNYTMVIGLYAFNFHMEIG